MSLLGALPPERFLAEYWQKKPLLVRQAIPGFSGFVSPRELVELAHREDAASRAVVEHKGKRRPRFELIEGPLDGLELAKAPRERFTFLVQGVERFVPAAWELLARFSFIPWARIDDLMISYAAPGGSVGPHVDQYDVFLLQGMGRRRWQIAEGGDLTCRDDEELRILRDFRPTDEWVLEPGDMLYLPPEVGHFGVAVDACMTYSVGFLAPSQEQLVGNFLAYLESEARARGMYTDPDLGTQEHPAELPSTMIAHTEAILDAVRFDTARVTDFLGRYLTGPKPLARFHPPKRPLDAKGFVSRLGERGTLALAPSTRMLSYRGVYFVNGEAFGVDDEDLARVQMLADTRRLALPVDVTDATRALLHRFYKRGFVELLAGA